MNGLKPLIVIAVAVALLYLYTWPQWNTVAALRARNVELQTALTKAQELNTLRNRLLDQYNAISPADTEKISKVVPAQYDPIKLVADINALAVRHGMLVRDVKIISPTQTSQTGAVVTASPEEPYTKRELSFTTQGQYRNFISFLSELEVSLQLLDLEKVDITAAPKSSPTQSATNLDFKVTLNTYWIQ